MFFVAIELKVFRSLRKAENVDFVIFVGLIVEQLNVVYGVNGINISDVGTGEPVTFAGKDAFVLGVFAVKIMVAETD